MFEILARIFWKQTLIYIARAWVGLEPLPTPNGGYFIRLGTPVAAEPLQLSSPIFAQTFSAWAAAAAAFIVLKGLAAKAGQLLASGLVELASCNAKPRRHPQGSKAKVQPHLAVLMSRSNIR